MDIYNVMMFVQFEWVEHHLGWKWINKLIVTKDKTVVSGDLLIDDKPIIKGNPYNLVVMHKYLHIDTHIKATTKQ